MTIALDDKASAAQAFDLQGMPEFAHRRSHGSHPQHAHGLHRQDHRAVPGPEIALNCSRRGSLDVRHLTTTGHLRLLAALAGAGCATVQPLQRGMLADSCMVFGTPTVPSPI